ncbi:hypothetical protein C5S53_15030 [Methanophagales archaeon]|nr:hypothetical protein C5S53_15030 [Methanophagales archaeon]
MLNLRHESNLWVEVILYIHLKNKAQYKIVIPTHYLEADPEEYKEKVEARADNKAVPLQI